MPPELLPEEYDVDPSCGYKSFDDKIRNVVGTVVSGL